MCPVLSPSSQLRPGLFLCSVAQGRDTSSPPGLPRAGQWGVQRWWPGPPALGRPMGVEEGPSESHPDIEGRGMVCPQSVPPSLWHSEELSEQEWMWGPPGYSASPQDVGFRGPGQRQGPRTAVCPPRGWVCLQGCFGGPGRRVGEDASSMPAFWIVRCLVVTRTGRCEDEVA